MGSNLRLRIVGNGIVIAVLISVATFIGALISALIGVLVATLVSALIGMLVAVLVATFIGALVSALIGKSIAMGAQKLTFTSKFGCPSLADQNIRQFWLLFLPLFFNFAVVRSMAQVSGTTTYSRAPTKLHHNKRVHRV